MVPGTRSVKPQLQLVPERKAGFWKVGDGFPGQEGTVPFLCVRVTDTVPRYPFKSRMCHCEPGTSILKHLPLEASASLAIKWAFRC